MRQHRQGFMECWNPPRHTVSSQKPTMLDGEMKNSRVLWKVRDTENGARRMACQNKKKRDSLVVLPVKGKKRRQEWVRGNRFPSNSWAVLPAQQNPAITNVKVLSWVIMSQTCCQCPQESLLFELFQFTSEFIAQEGTNIYLIQIGMSPYIQ